MPHLDFRLLQKQARKDNTIGVKLSVAHNGSTRYIGTGISVTSVDQFKNGTIVKRPDASFKNTQLRNFMFKIEERIANVEYIDGLSCSELINLILRGDRMPSTIGEIFREYISTARLAEKLVELSKWCFSSISTFLGPDFCIKNSGMQAL